MLRRLPDELLREADRRAEQDYEALWRRRGPARRPGLDPWQFLIDAPVVTDEFKRVFRAAQSQLAALRRLSGMMMGRATLKTDWYEEAVKALAKGDNRKYEHASTKTANAVSRYDKVQRDLREQAKDDPELSRHMDSWFKKRREELVHRGKGNEAEQAKPFPNWNEGREKHKLPCALGEGWVRCGPHGVPGLLFWRNEAQTKFLSYILSQQNLTAHAVKQTRRRLGLIPLGHHRFCIWHVSITRDQAGKLEVCCYWRDGKRAF